ncbi:30S ribosomal protein S17 [Candidatus Gottesmanbacteria bacterium]|nr:30S ribosomal protein S17 [Candidatus Gottesmanbacteria bacterium]
MKKNETGLIGNVVSVKSKKTIIVTVMHTVRHPIYKKQSRIRRRFAVHNEKENLIVGDRVRIAEIRPMSKTKHYIVMEKFV